MKTFCKHEPHKVIDDILEPRYHDDSLLIAKYKVPEHIEHVLIKFKKCTKYPDWFYMSAKLIRKHPTQKNGAGSVYCVPMNKREPFAPINNCDHEI